MLHFNVYVGSIIFEILEEGRLKIDTSASTFAVTVEYAGYSRFNCFLGLS
jgi:hypothetical protein